MELITQDSLNKTIKSRNWRVLRHLYVKYHIEFKSETFTTFIDTYNEYSKEDENTLLWLLSIKCPIDKYTIRACIRKGVSEDNETCLAILVIDKYNFKCDKKQCLNLAIESGSIYLIDFFMKME